MEKIKCKSAKNEETYFYPKELCIDIGGFENEEINWFLSWPSHCCCTATAAIQWISREWKTLHLHCADKYGWNSSNISFCYHIFPHCAFSSITKGRGRVGRCMIENRIRIHTYINTALMNPDFKPDGYSILFQIIVFSTLSACVCVCVSLFR